MELAVIIEGILKATIAQQPWIYYKDALAEKDINILVYQGNDEAFKRPFDAMLLHVWQHWSNKKFFDPLRILPIMEKHAIYRVEFPETVQIILNHKDMSRRPYATPYWRAGDPILYRTPAYDRKELYPFPPDQIWAYEKVWGSPCFVPNTVSQYKAVLSAEQKCGIRAHFGRNIFRFFYTTKVQGWFYWQSKRTSRLSPECCKGDRQGRS